MQYNRLHFYISDSPSRGLDPRRIRCRSAQGQVQCRTRGASSLSGYHVSTLNKDHGEARPSESQRLRRYQLFHRLRGTALMPQGGLDAPLPVYSCEFSSLFSQAVYLTSQRTRMACANDCLNHSSASGKQGRALDRAQQYLSTSSPANMLKTEQAYQLCGASYCVTPSYYNFLCTNA